MTVAKPLPFTRVALFFVGLVGLPLVAAAADTPAEAARDQATVQAVFAKYCTSCHGADVQEAGLRLDSAAALAQGGENYGPAVVAGQPDNSPLFRFVADPKADLRMPPKGVGPNPAEVAALRRWITAGAAWPSQADRLAGSSSHWAFQPLERPSVPVYPRTANPIDSYIRYRLRRARLEPSPRANAPTLLRRLAFVMHGLPPSPEEADAWIALNRHNEPFQQMMNFRKLAARIAATSKKGWADPNALAALQRAKEYPRKSEQASAEEGRDSPMLLQLGIREYNSLEQQRLWEQQVDRALASPHYGERWGQHWLDVVRFGETNGFETNRERPHAWRYRDYVIDAFNRDLPFDQFVREQIAGDTLGAPVATGFLVAGPTDIVKGRDPLLGLMQRQDELTDMVNTAGTAFLGLTLGCARCHNHKFDPVTQVDFYALQAVFAGVRHGDRALPIPADQQTALAAVDRRQAELQTLLEPFRAQPRPGESPRREPVNARHNVERLPPTPARTVRFTILATNSAQPCLDELAVFAGDEQVSLASRGTVARCSSSLPGYDIHKLEHVNDGQYGNSHSWISNEVGAGWVELEFPAVMTIDRIEWGRDRLGRFSDRLATGYRIEIAVEPGAWRTVASSDDRQPFGQKHAAELAKPAYDFTRAEPAAAAAAQAWLAELNALEERRKQLSEPPQAYMGQFGPSGEVKRLFRGDPLAPREVVGPDTIALLGTLGLPADAPEAERRAAFARWLTQPDNPLTARVWVNRIWQYQFGKGLVETASDFGANGIPPTHPELLDWLACELIDSGWSTKHIHRMILTSATWQQSSQPRPDGLTADAGCSLWWRFPPRRLEAEPIRDTILAVAGSLDLQLGGPAFPGFEIQYENVRHYLPKADYGPSDWRRMVYMLKVRMEKDTTFGVFDCPDATQVVARRSLSTTPLQALNLFNSRFIQQQAERFAARLTAEAGADLDAQVRRAYALAYQRAPDDDEHTAAVGFVEAHGLPALCRALLNSNELVFVP